MDTTPDPTPPPDTAPPRWPALDGLRGLAVAAVVAYHLGHLSGGFLGVDLFFVLSGFLITSLLLREGTGSGRIDLRRFWIRRARRLLPALGATLVGVVVLSRIALDHDRLPALRLDALATLAYIANWRFAIQPEGGYFAADPSPLRHAWSLSIEEQYYLVWPLLVIGALALAARRDRSMAAVVGGIAVLGAVASTAWSAAHASTWTINRLYLGTDTRVVAPLVGAALAALMARRPTPSTRATSAPVSRATGIVAGLGLVALAVATTTVEASDGWLYRGGFAALAVLAAVVVHGGTVATSGPLVSVLSLAPLRWLGERSYGLYLYSWPVQLVAEDQGFDGAALAAATVATSLVLAEASHRWLEMPIRHGALARPRVQPAAIASLAFVLVTGFVVVGTMTDERPDPLQALTTEELQEGARRPPVTTDAAPEAPRDDAPVRVLVVGDSVGYTLGEYAPDDIPGVASVDPRALPGCSLLTSGDRPRAAVEAGSPEDYDGCAEPIVDADRLGLEGDPDVVLLVTGAWERADHERGGRTTGPGDARWTEDIRTLLVDRVDSLSSEGATVALWSDPCGADADVRERQQWYAEEVLTPVAEEHPRATIVDPSSEVCRDGDARDDIPDVGDPRPDDGQHWSEEGAAWLWRSWLGPTLQDAAVADDTGHAAGPPPTTTEPPPATDPTADPVSGVVFGDSIAFTLDYHGRPGAQAAGIDLINGGAVIGCGLVREGTIANGDRDLAEGCAGITAIEDDVLASSHTEVGIAYWGAWEMVGVDDLPGAGSGQPGDPAYDALIADILRERLTAIGRSTDQVVVLAIDCWPAIDETRSASRVRWWRDLSRRVAEEVGATWLDPTPVLCDDGQPRTDIPGVGNPRPADGGHWSEAGARWFWVEWLGPRLHELASGAR